MMEPSNLSSPIQSGPTNASTILREIDQSCHRDIVQCVSDTADSELENVAVNTGLLTSTTNKEDRSLQQEILSGDTVESVQKDVVVHIDDTLKGFQSQWEGFSASMIIQFKDVKYSLRIKATHSTRLSNCLSVFKPTTYKEKLILHGFTGFVCSGEMMALLGPSGSGKTTFLHLLSGHDLNFRGSIKYNNCPYTKKLRSRMGFVSQKDFLHPFLTAHETLVYSAFLKLPKIMSRNLKLQRVEDIISELDLNSCKNTIIGGQMVKGISGGEKKRVCIGQEIITRPSILFLDEPTSGLDSTTALRIVKILRAFSKAGNIVVTSIHQPSSHQFYSFDKILLISGGRPLYSGGPGESLRYFATLGFSPSVIMNPAEFLLNLTHGSTLDISFDGRTAKLLDLKWIDNDDDDDASDSLRSQKILQYLADKYKDPVEIKLKFKNNVDPHLSYEKVSDTCPWNATWWTQIKILSSRVLKETKHEILSWVRLSQILVAALIVGILWWHSRKDTSEHLKDQEGLLYVITLFWGGIPLTTASMIFCHERPLLVKERIGNMYRLSSYFISRTLGDLPMNLFLATIYLLVVYFMTSLKLTGATLPLTFVGLYLNIMAAQGLGYFIGASIKDAKKASATASIVILSCILLGGYYVAHVPAWISWLKYLSFNYYAFQLLLKIQYSKYVPSWNGGVSDAVMLLMLSIAYRLLAYIALRFMKLRTWF